MYSFICCIFEIFECEKWHFMYQQRTATSTIPNCKRRCALYIKANRTICVFCLFFRSSKYFSHFYQHLWCRRVLLSFDVFSFARAYFNDVWCRSFVISLIFTSPINFGHLYSSFGWYHLFQFGFFRFVTSFVVVVFFFFFLCCAFQMITDLALDSQLIIELMLPKNVSRNCKLYL